MADARRAVLSHASSVLRAFQSPQNPWQAAAEAVPAKAPEAELKEPAKEPEAEAKARL